MFHPVRRAKQAASTNTWPVNIAVDPSRTTSGLSWLGRTRPSINPGPSTGRPSLSSHSRVLRGTKRS
eukprot:3981372-Amphidinium_carterae.1